jgi:hypothetical protein
MEHLRRCSSGEYDGPIAATYHANEERKRTEKERRRREEMEEKEEKERNLL